MNWNIKSQRFRSVNIHFSSLGRKHKNSFNKGKSISSSGTAWSKQRDIFSAIIYFKNFGSDGYVIHII